jgi:hypothetical protein
MRKKYCVESKPKTITENDSDVLNDESKAPIEAKTNIDQDAQREIDLQADYLRKKVNKLAQTMDKNRVGFKMDDLQNVFKNQKLMRFVFEKLIFFREIDSLRLAKTEKKDKSSGISIHPLTFQVT